jgi:hypothetical protein
MKGGGGGELVAAAVAPNCARQISAKLPPKLSPAIFVPRVSQQAGTIGRFPSQEQAEIVHHQVDNALNKVGVLVMEALSLL